MAKIGKTGIVLVTKFGAQVKLISPMSKQEILEARERARTLGTDLRIPTTNDQPDAVNEEIFINPEHIGFLSMCDIVATLIQPVPNKVLTDIGSSGKGSRNGFQ